MSRALDPKIKAALNQGNHAPVYRCVADVLSTRKDELLDIEVLGPSHMLPAESYVLHEGNAIAVPKVNILRAFLPAYNIFKAHLNEQHVAPEELLRATSVILLLDPEHMSAANTRKRYIRRIKEHSPEQLDNALDRELYFIDSLLTSRLHRHTKSPTLWGHREWLVEQCIERRRPLDSLPAALEKLIFVSAERHPRNYYAWCHARYLLGLGGRRSQGQDGDEQGQQPQQQQQQQPPPLASQQQRDTATLDAATDMMKKWCFNHHNDISGWSFLMVLVEQRPTAATAAAPALFSETLHLVETFSWRGESVWWFLRTLLLRRKSWLGAAQREEFERVLRLVHGKVAAPEKLDEQILGHMLEWTRLYADREG